MTSLINEFVYLTLILYLLSAAGYFLAPKNKMLKRFAFILAFAGFLANTLALTARTLLVGRLPLASGAEFALCFSWFTVLLYLILQLKTGNKEAGGIVMLISGLLVSSIIILMPGQLGDTKPLMPALKSPWLTSHVLTAAAAYAGFALAAGLAASQLIKPKLRKAEEWTNKIIAFSFVLLTVTIVLGAIWAEQAWGSYWSWDPKEVWAMITWIVYALYLHLHRRQNWKGRKANILAVAGFIIVLFTKYGVNFLLSGLHSYS